MPRSSKHGYGRLVLTNTRCPWHACVVIITQVLTTARRSIICSHAAQLSTACSRGPRTVRSAFSEIGSVVHIANGYTESSTDASQR